MLAIIVPALQYDLLTALAVPNRVLAPNFEAIFSMQQYATI
jgi:hypothetical protein